MENQPIYNRSDGSKNKEGEDKESVSYSYANVYRPPVEKPAMQERRIPLAPAFEGIISWRDDEKSKSDEETSKNEESKDKEKEKDGKAAKQPLSVPIPRAPLESQPLFTHEQERQDTEETESESNEKDEESAEFTEPQFAYPENAEPSVHYASPAEQGRPHDPAHGEFVAVNPPHSPAESLFAEDSTEPEQPTAAAPSPGIVGQHPVATPNIAPTPAQANTGHNQLPTFQQNTANANQAPAPQNNTANVNQQPTTPQNPNQAPVPPQPAAGNSGNQPPQPPNTPNMGYSQPAWNPNHYGHNPYLYNQQANQVGNVAPASANAPAMPLETGNRDPRVGPVAALLGLEYIGRKRADKKLERKMNKQIQQSNKQQEQSIAANHLRMQEQQQQFAQEQQRQSEELRNVQQYQTAEQAPAGAAVGPTPNTYAAPQQAGQQYFEAPRPAQPVNTNERPFAPSEARPPAPIIAPEVQQQVADQNEQGIDLKPNQHVEHSAWHNIVVDERGNEVEGAINYGEGYQRERQQELYRDRPKDDATSFSGGSSQGTSPVAPQSGVSTYPGALPSGMTSPSLQQGQPTHSDPQHQLASQNDKQPSNITNPWFWVMLLLIVAAFFTAAVI